MKKIILLVVSIVLCAATPIYAKSKTLWLVGDATLAEYPVDSAGATGWGTTFEQFICTNITTVNHADTGMSAKVFIENGMLEKMEELDKNSFILLQLGTNDLKEYNPAQYSSTEAFIRRLNTIIAEANKHKINIILCTPLAQPYYRNGILIDRLGSYPDIVRHIALYHQLPLIDLEQTSRTWLQEMTEEEAATFYVTLDPSQLINGEYQLNTQGAEIIAKMVKDAIAFGENKKTKLIIEK